MALDKLVSGIRSMFGKKNPRSDTKHTRIPRNLTKELKTRNYEEGKELLSPGTPSTGGDAQGETAGVPEAPEAGPLNRAAFLRQLLGGVGASLSDDQVVQEAMARGWITEARPSDAITRAEAAVILCRVNNIQPLSVNEIKRTFKDLPVTHWAAPYVYALALNGVVHGFADETFKPDDVLEDDVVAGLIERSRNPPGLDANGFDPTKAPPRQTEFPVMPEPASDSRQDVAAYIHNNFPNGIPIALYNSIEESEFKSQAENWAKREKAVAVVSGAPKLGLAVPLTNMDVGVLAGLVNGIAAGVKQFMDQVDAEFHTGYNYPSQNIERIAIFTHGYMNDNNTGGLRVGSSRLTSNNLFTDPNANLPENQQGLINRIQASLSGSVRIMMYSCSVGRNSNETREYAAAETDGGAQSFAATLRDGLAGAGKNGAEVWAHSYAGHTTQQPAIRRFRASEQGQDGKAYFNLVFPEDFIQEQVARMQEAKTAGRLRNFNGVITFDRVRAAMHSFYIIQSRVPRDGHDEYAELIPLYPEIVKNRLQDEWMAYVGTTPQ